MAALLLSFAGASLGGALLGPLGIVAGRLVGAVTGAVIDRALFSGKRLIEGPRLSDLDVMASTEGAPVPRDRDFQRRLGAELRSLPATSATESALSE